MKGTSKVIMGATLIMVLSLAIVLSLILVLLAELYCSLLARRRHSNTPSEDAEAAPAVEATLQLQNGQSTSAPPLGRIYSHGVLNNAPRKFLFPSLSRSVSFNHDEASDLKKNSQQLRQFLGEAPAANSTYSLSASVPLQVRILSSTPPSPNQATKEEPQLHASVVQEEANGSTSTSSKEHEHLVYISNPIFDEHNSSRATTPYATPDTSPSRLGNTSGSSDEDDDKLNAPKQHIRTPPLSPMKELPAEASCSVSLKDTKCLNTSGSDSHSVNATDLTSSSVTPCASPSW